MVTHPPKKKISKYKINKIKALEAEYGKSAHSDRHLTHSSVNITYLGRHTLLSKIGLPRGSVPSSNS